MRYRRVFLVRSAVKLYGGYLPVGLGIISEALTSAGVEHDVLDMNLGYKNSDLFSRIASFNPDLVGVNMMSFMHKHAYAMVNAIREAFPGVAIVAGGPHVSLFREDVLKECPGIDYGVVGEGEETIVDLCMGNAARDIKGLLYRIDGDVQYTGDRPLIADLGVMSFPRYRKFDIAKYVNEVPLYSSRGCPYDCIFCSVHTVIGKGFRARPAELVLEEIEFWYNLGYRNFTFFDDNFSQDMKRIARLCQLMKVKSFPGARYICSDVRADKLDRPLLQAMWDVGFREVDLGVEGGNNRILKIIRKGVSIERVEETIRNACDLGFDVRLFFQVGLPGQTVSDVEDAIALAMKHPIKMAHFFNTVPTPKTRLFELVQEDATFLMNPLDYMNGAFHTKDMPLFETKDFPLSDRKRMIRRAQRVSILTLKRYYLRKLSNYGLLGSLVVALGVNRPLLRLREMTLVWNLIASLKGFVGRLRT